MSKPKVEAIYPLTFMQQTLLLHSLHESVDQGFLQVSCNLEGTLDVMLLKKAWQQCIQRHGALRTSVHWKKIKKPVQIVHSMSTLPWTDHDLTQLSPKAQQKKIAKFKKENNKQSFDLSTAPISRLALIQLKPDSYQMLWSCHHILLDGWSAALIIKDVFDFYDALCKNKTASPEPVPSYQSYLNWGLKQDPAEAKLFWQQKFKGFKKPTLLTNKLSSKLTDSNAFAVHSISLSVDDTSRLHSFVRQHQVTLSTLVQCSWGLLLCRYANTNDTTFGTTVSGRNTGLPNMELLAGIFTNVLPSRLQWEPHVTFPDWLKNFQAGQSEIQNFEYSTLDQINTWIHWPGELPLLDSLLVFENFPWNTFERGGIKVKDLSGGITSIYPITVVVIPGETLNFEIKYDKNRIPKATIMWLSQQLEWLLQSVRSQAKASVADLFNNIATPAMVANVPDLDSHAVRNKSELFLQNGKQNALIAPRNHMELQVTKIWEQIFGHSAIGVTENFFDIGGTSILAVRLLALVEQKLERNLPPATLLQNPTIAALAKVLSNEESMPDWSALVPLRTRGSKPPIFCMHAGGGHVYFYHSLTRRLDPDQPVYSLQPIGLDGISAFHKSIKEMAANYLKEMRTVQPNGPYALLGTCFSNAVCLEIAHQLKKIGESISLLVIVDSGGRELGRRVQTVVPAPPIQKRLKRFINLDFKDARDAVLKKITKKVDKLKKKWTILTETRQAKNLREMQEHLGRLYEDYFWEPCREKVTLIRSSEFNDDPDKGFHIERWSAIALGGLSVFVVPGKHLTLFEEPDVRNLAIQMQECLNQAHKQPVSANLSP